MSLLLNFLLKLITPLLIYFKGSYDGKKKKEEEILKKDNELLKKNSKIVSNSVTDNELIERMRNGKF